MRLIALFVFLILASPAGATEKYWMASRAELAVVGKLRLTASYPMLDGWHFKGRIKVEEVLLGKGKPGEELSYFFTCNGCPYWPRPKLDLFTVEKGIWFLLPGKDGAWLSAGGTFPGFDADRPDMRDFLRRRGQATRTAPQEQGPWWKINLNRCWNQELRCFSWH